MECGAGAGVLQYGTVEELPRIYHRKEWESGLVSAPDYRVTCFFVDRDYRRSGVAAVALRGALDLVAAAGGGVVEGYPADAADVKANASLLYSATRSMFEDAGFVYERSKGENHCVMRTTSRLRARSLPGRPPLLGPDSAHGG